MATKNKARAKSGAAPGAPKPKIEPRKTPLMRRTWFRRTAAVVLVLLALWVSLFVWGRVSRSSQLRSYTTKLFNAGRPFFQDIQTGSNSMQQAIYDFKNNLMDSKALAVSAMIGMAAVSGSALMQRVAAHPSIASPRPMSIKMRSGRSLVAASMPDGPSSAKRTE